MNNITKDDQYMAGVSIKEAIDMIIRLHHELHNIVMELQDRVLDLEIKVSNNE